MANRTFGIVKCISYANGQRLLVPSAETVEFISWKESGNVAVGQRPTPAYVRPDDYQRVSLSAGQGVYTSHGDYTATEPMTVWVCRNGDGPSVIR